MTGFYRNLISVGVIVAALLAAVIFSVSYYVDAASDADRAAADLVATRSLTDQIKSLQGGTDAVSTAEPISARIAQLIDDAMKNSDIDSDKLTQLAPQPVQRLERDGTDLMSVRVVFHQVSLHQMLWFVTDLSKQEPGLCVGNLHLAYSADRPAESQGSDWNVELLISYSGPASAQPSAVVGRAD